MPSDSNANNSPDVDDVLSSIRKLVSEEARARMDEGRHVKKMPVSPSATPLMLTPSQEVDNAPDPLVLGRAQAIKAPSIIDEDIDVDATASFDEQVLRKIVSEMIREELQGELGDRITRNVRKLIKREIDVAMSRSEERLDSPAGDTQ